MPSSVASCKISTPAQVSRAYNRAVNRNDGYDDALTDLREEIRGLADQMPRPLAELIRAYFKSRVDDIALVLAEASAEDEVDGLEALSIECSSGPEGEGEVLLDLYEHLYTLTKSA